MAEKAEYWIGEDTMDGWMDTVFQPSPSMAS